MNSIKKAVIATLISMPLSALALPSSTYVGLEAGMQQSKFEIGPYSDKNGWTGRVYGGHLLASDNAFQYGFELGGSIYETLKIYDLELSHASLDLLAVGKYFFAPKWDLFAKGGLALDYQKSELGENSHSEVGFLPKAALGIGFQVTNNQHVGFGVSRIFGKNNYNGSDNLAVNTMTLSWEYHF